MKTQHYAAVVRMSALMMKRVKNQRYQWGLQIGVKKLLEMEVIKTVVQFVPLNTKLLELLYQHYEREGSSYR